MRVDIDKLRQCMTSANISIAELAKRIGVDQSTMHRKFQRRGETFTVGEMHKISEVVGISKEDAMHIFFV